MKDLKNLDGAKVLNKKEQQTILGGKIACDTHHDCPPGQCCMGAFGGTYCGIPNSGDDLCYPMI